MEEKIEIVNRAFEAEIDWKDLDKRDLDKKVADVLIWDSFHIMNYLVEVEERFHKRITVEQISEVESLHDLLQLMEIE